MKNSLSDNNIYPNVCKNAVENDDIFNTFKNIPAYTEILEHVTEQQGLEYIKIIKRDNNHLFEKIKNFTENDKYGNPKKYPYDGIGVVSPSTLRYIKVLSDLLKIFKDLNGYKIIEIGGGYGGQCKIISDYFIFLEYYIVDLLYPLKLTEKYLNKLNVKNFKILTMEDLHNEEYDLVISNYAFTELNKNIQDIYTEKIIKKSKHAYITCNVIGGIDTYSVNELFNLNDKINILNEEPLTHKNNFILYW